MHRTLRVSNELQQLKNDQGFKGVQLLDCHPEFQSATFAFSGPIDSPYEGYWFRILVKWPEQYPLAPPILTLIDKIWNPYVDFDKNKVCVDIIKQNFSPALTTPKVLLSIVSLLSETKVGKNHQGFANSKAAAQMMNNYPYFCNQVRKICESHSFKKKQIYQDSQRGRPEDHFIKAQGKELEDLVEEQSKNPKMFKHNK